MQIKKYLNLVWRFPFAVGISVLISLLHLLVSLASFNKEGIEIFFTHKHTRLEK